MKRDRPAEFRLILGLLLSLLVFCPAGVGAEETGDFASWIAGLRREAQAAGISAATLDSALSGLQPLAKVVAADRNQPEFTRTLEEYLASAVSEERVREGRELLKRHRRLLGRLAVRYKIPPRILVALWGVETNFGRHQGNIPVIAALATLAYDGRRSDYFRGELFEALRILDAGQIPAEQLRGSWAGAMGQLQFMPSTFRHYAVDESGDGRSDIFANEADVLASAANYLARSGWETDQTWGREVRLPKKFDRNLLGLEQQLKLSRWQQLGVRQINGKALPKAAMQGAIVQPDGAGGRVFLVYQNYRVLRIWNKSHHFALAVGLLADRILAR
jgi:membrane-bound lytic murein transglycosylase B